MIVEVYMNEHAYMDYYYIDEFNLVPDKRNIGDNDKAITNTSNTIRLYTVNNNDIGTEFTAGTLKDLILVAPYIEPIGIYGTNEFQSANLDPFSDIMSNVINKFGEGMEFINDIKRSLSNAKSFLDGLKTLVEEKGVTFNRSGPGNLATTDKDKRAEAIKQINAAPAQIRLSSPTEVVKAYSGTSIELPTKTLSVSYLSDPSDKWSNNKFNWLGQGNGGSEINVNVTTADKTQFTVETDPYQPLKTMAKYLCRVLLGQISSSNDGLTILYEAPNLYASLPGRQSNYSKNSLCLCIGNGIIITNLIPTSLDIRPSRYLTIYGDYYSMDVTVNIDISRYILSDELDMWIDNAGYKPYTKDYNHKTKGGNAVTGTTATGG